MPTSIESINALIPRLKPSAFSLNYRNEEMRELDKKLITQLKCFLQYKILISAKKKYNQLRITITLKLILLQMKN